MIDIALLSSGWAGLIGYRQTTNSAAPQVKDWLLPGSGGLYINDVAPAVLTSENILAVLPADYVAPAGDDTDYGAGRQGALNFALSRALEGSRAWLGSALLADARNEGRARTVVSECSLFEGVGNSNTAIIKGGRFCGIELRPHPNPDIVVEVARIGLQTLGDDATGLIFYLYHESRPEPLARWISTAPLNGWGRGFGWLPVPSGTFVLRAGGDESRYPAGGAFYLGYYEDDLNGQVANRPLPVLRYDCASCDPINYARAMAWADVMQARACRLSNEYVADREELPLNRMSYPADTNNGLNLALLARCDLTPLLLRNKYALSGLYRLSTAIELLTLCLTSVADNAAAVSLRDRSGLLLYGDANTKRGGLIKERDDMLKGLALDLTGSRPPCLRAPGAVRITSGAV